MLEERITGWIPAVRSLKEIFIYFMILIGGVLVKNMAPAGAEHTFPVDIPAQRRKYVVFYLLQL